jgi:hypothetical protein
MFHIDVLVAAPVAHCNALLYVVDSLLVIAVASTSGLFFFRVRAVYGNDKIITAVFGFLWFAIFGVCFLIPLSTKGMHLGTTERCIFVVIPHFVSIPALIRSGFDTMVFFAISLHIISYSIIGDTFGARMKSFFRGDGLPRLSKSLLHGGQLYYLFVAISCDFRYTLTFFSSVTIIMNVVVATLILSPVPPIFRTMFVLPQIALDSSMACRVFRGLQLGFLVDDVESVTVRLTYPSPASRRGSIVRITKDQGLRGYQEEYDTKRQSMDQRLVLESV